MTQCPYCDKLCHPKFGIKTHLWRVHGEGKTHDPNHGYKNGTRIGWRTGRGKTPNEILVKGGKKSGIRNALIKIGRSYECENCHIGNEWCEKSLTLQIDHIDGDNTKSRTHEFTISLSKLSLSN